MESIKNFFKTILAKRCKCKDTRKPLPPVTNCIRCGDLLKDCTCTNQVAE